MILKSLHLTHFKNHQAATFDFADQINCVLGKNGVGKTNLLDAIYYLSFTKSAIGAQDRLTITHDQPAFTVLGKYDACTIAIQFEKGKTKALKIDGKEAEKMSDVIGKVPLVMVLPDDTLMIKEGSDARRRFFDGAISQFDSTFLANLLRYSKVLKQRNSLLKQSKGAPINHQLIETYDEQLIPLAIEISKSRQSLVAAFIPFLEKNYQELHEGREAPGLKFKTHVTEFFEEAFKSSFQKDLIMQRTLMGSHKDDVEFLLDEDPIKRFGSQGQQKTFIISLKLALYDFLSEKMNEKPLLLLDDIFDKLDDSRIALLVELLKNNKRFGQIFITDARTDRSEVLFKKTKKVKFFRIENKGIDTDTSKLEE